MMFRIKCLASINKWTWNRRINSPPVAVGWGDIHFWRKYLLSTRRANSLHSQCELVICQSDECLDMFHALYTNNVRWWNRDPSNCSGVQIKVCAIQHPSICPVKWLSRRNKVLHSDRKKLVQVLNTHKHTHWLNRRLGCGSFTSSVWGCSKTLGVFPIDAVIWIKRLKCVYST